VGDAIAVLIVGIVGELNRGAVIADNDDESLELAYGGALCGERIGTVDEVWDDAENFENSICNEGFFILWERGRVSDVYPLELTLGSAVFKNGIDVRRLIGVEGMLSLFGNRIRALGFRGREKGEASAMTREPGDNDFKVSGLARYEEEGFRDDIGGVTKDSAEEGGVGASKDVAVLIDAGDIVE
jgi:hypothetical protein